MSKCARTGWKTTIMGLVIMAAAVVSVFLVDAVNWMDASIGIAIGLGLVFSPDDIISRIKDFLSKKADNVNP
jgi:hypothetical protein